MIMTMNIGINYLFVMVADFRSRSNVRAYYQCPFLARSALDLPVHHEVLLEVDAGNTTTRYNISINRLVVRDADSV